MEADDPNITTWSGQVRVFNVHIQSNVIAHACPGQEKKGGVMGGGGGGAPVLAGTREYEQYDRNR